MIHLGQTLVHSKHNKNVCCCHSYSITVNIMIIITEAPAFLACCDNCHPDWSPTSQAVPSKAPPILLHLKYSSYPVLQHLLFTLKYFPTVLSPSLDDSNLPLKSILLLQMPPKSRPVCIPRCPSAPQIRSRIKLNIFLLSLASPPVYHITKYHHRPPCCPN